MGIRIRIRKKQKTIYKKPEKITDTSHEELMKRLDERIKWMEEKQRKPEEEN